jgi:beta-glucanase (GH16 family)
VIFKILNLKGLWPALWMLGNSYYTGSRVWPACGEIDILENVGKEPLQIHGALHGPSYDPQVLF